VPREPPDLSGLYESKEAEYFENARSEVLSFVPSGAKRILDVGCGAGMFSWTLKQQRGAEVWGIELSEAASRKASTRLDRVLNAPFGPDLELPTAYFDAICFLDVLEHIPEPVDTLRHASTLLAPDGRLVASLPNFRHFDNMWNLVVKKSARYERGGIMDRTHLRIFTQSSIGLLFEEAGLTVERIEGINPKRGSHKFALFNAITLGSIADMRFLQFAVVARRT
jgi:2-polyprenyl-3-methyl-5-hydroxy-6-metoxy-1,4-benzoquinol methylase